jgi:AcrR family transcriptional regulator
MAERKMGSDRRMGPAGSDNWHAMLDGAEDILREEGHAALTSRRIAERIGVKQRLVYYYFRTMDDLIVHLFRRSAGRDIERLRFASASSAPLRELWQISFRSHDARLISEYMAMANRIPALRTEVIAFIEQSRALQVEAIAAALARNPGASPLPPAALALIATSVGLSLNREQQLGISAGHSEFLSVLDTLVEQLDSPAP